MKVNGRLFKLQYKYNSINKLDISMHSNYQRRELIKIGVENLFKARDTTYTVHYTMEAAASSSLQQININLNSIWIKSINSQNGASIQITPSLYVYLFSYLSLTTIYLFRLASHIDDIDMATTVTLFHTQQASYQAVCLSLVGLDVQKWECSVIASKVAARTCVLFSRLSWGDKFAHLFIQLPSIYSIRFDSIRMLCQGESSIQFSVKPAHKHTS